MTKLKLTLAFCHGLLVGGQTASLLADAATARDPGGAPMIPASAVKGALRIEFERLLAGLPDKDRPYICHPDKTNESCTLQNPCLVCLLFGSHGREGNLRFYDAILEDEVRHIFTRRERTDQPEKPTGRGYMLRPGVAINRLRKTAEENMLFLSQVAPPLTFTARIDLRSSWPDRGLAFLKASVESLKAIGADKSRGLGHLKATLKEIPDVAITGDTSIQTHSQFSDIQLTLTPDEYLRVSNIKVTDNFLESMDFIPGSCVRGAIAQSYITREKHGNWQDEAVRDAFLRQPIIVSNFYPTIANLPFRPVPLSARTCKHYKGFTSFSGKEETHGVKDILIASTLVKLLRQSIDGWIGLPVILQDRCSDRRCFDRPSPLKQLEGFCRSDGTTAVGSLTNVPRRTTTKTAINRTRFTSEEGKLYSYELLDTQLQESAENRLRFIGTIRRLPEELKKHLTHAEFLLIGGSRGRGFGKLRLEQPDTAPQPEGEIEAFTNRLDRFTAVIQESLKLYKHPKQTHLFLALTLLSDLIFPVGQGLDWLVEEIRQRLGLPDAKLCLEKFFIQVGYRSGFNMAVGIAKDLLPALEMGSSFVFSYPEDNHNNIREAIISNLPNLLRSGIGWRREEGYGQLSFCDEFHLQHQQQS